MVFTNKWVVNGKNYGINFRKLEENSCNYPIGSMYAIYGNIYHQYTPMLAYIPYMDPMGMVNYNYNLQLVELRSQVIFVGFPSKFGE